jgi:CDP-glucose 4,6-dehydratase
MNAEYAVSPTFWAGRKVLVTGHTGFKGSWLTMWLRELGAEVTGFSLPDDDPTTRTRRVFDPNVRSLFGDVRDYDATLEAARESGAEVAFHLAAQPLVRASYLDPLTTISVNVVGTANVLKAIHELGRARSAVIVTTDKCYQDMGWPWGYRENDRLGGHDPYSASKACAEIVAASFRSSFFSEPGATAVATARAGNVIGGGDWAKDRLIPDVARAIAAGEPVHVRRPDAVRPWQHVLDPLAGYLKLAETAAEDATFADAWNFGPEDGDGRPVRWMAEEFSAAWGGTIGWVYDEGPHPHETELLRLDCSMARRRLGWRPLLDTREAVAWTSDWYRRLSLGEKPLELTIEQIRAYMALNSKKS